MKNAFLSMTGAVSIALTASAASAQPALLLNGEFQLYKPGEPTVTAELTGGYVPWNGVIPPTNLSIINGSANYSDGTSGSTVDLPGWTKIQGNTDILHNGPEGSLALNTFAAWGGRSRVQSTPATVGVGANTTYTITAQIDGPDGGPIEGELAFHLMAGSVQLTADEALPSFTGGLGFQTITRTYTIVSLPVGVSAGAPLTVVLGVGDNNNFGNRMIWDNVKLIADPPDPGTLIVVR